VGGNWRTWFNKEEGAHEEDSEEEERREEAEGETIKMGYGTYGRSKRYVLSESFKKWLKSEYGGTPIYSEVVDNAELTGSNLTKKNKREIKAWVRREIYGEE